MEESAVQGAATRGTADPLVRLQGWYTSMCNGTWEPGGMATSLS